VDDDAHPVVRVEPVRRQLAKDDEQPFLPHVHVELVAGSIADREAKHGARPPFAYDSHFRAGRLPVEVSDAVDVEADIGEIAT
jgi:hypothetical protein